MTYADALYDWHSKWDEIDIYAPMTLDGCRKCAALIIPNTHDIHLAWHEATEAATRALAARPEVTS